MRRRLRLSTCASGWTRWSLVCFLRGRGRLMGILSRSLRRALMCMLVWMCRLIGRRLMWRWLMSVVMGFMVLRLRRRVLVRGGLLIGLLMIKESGLMGGLLYRRVGRRRRRLWVICARPVLRLRSGRARNCLLVVRSFMTLCRRVFFATVCSLCWIRRRLLRILNRLVMRGCGIVRIRLLIVHRWRRRLLRCGHC